MWKALLRPVLPEERTAAVRARATLPESVRTADQTIGRSSAGCAATYGIMERCDFGCTACYLAEGSNAAEPQHLADAVAQDRPHGSANRAIADCLRLFRASAGCGSRTLGHIGQD